MFKYEIETDLSDNAFDHLNRLQGLMDDLKAPTENKTVPLTKRRIKSEIDYYNEDLDLIISEAKKLDKQEFDEIMALVRRIYNFYLLNL